MKKLLLAMMFVLIAVSCGGDDETMEEAAERYAKVMCKKIFACEETSAYEAFVGGTESACVTLMTAEPEEEEGEETTETAVMKICHVKISQKLCRVMKKHAPHVMKPVTTNSFLNFFHR